MDYRIIRSKRKTLALQITPEGLLVRAPYFVSDAQIRRFVRGHEDWIRKKTESIARQEEQRQREQADIVPLTVEDIRALAGRAMKVIPERVRYWAEKIGVTYGRITIRNQRTRWGSCSSKGNLNFNCLLMLTPDEVIDSVVVHELCHRKEMNHSARFYTEVLKVFPDYRKWEKWLKVNGPAIMRRMT